MEVGTSIIPHPVSYVKSLKEETMDAADLNDYRIALKSMPDNRLVMELVTAHHVYLGSISADTHYLDRYNAAKAEVLARMDYEAGRPK